MGWCCRRLSGSGRGRRRRRRPPPLLVPNRAGRIAAIGVAVADGAGNHAAVDLDRVMLLRVKVTLKNAPRGIQVTAAHPCIKCRPANLLHAFFPLNFPPCNPVTHIVQPGAAGRIVGQSKSELMRDPANPAESRRAAPGAVWRPLLASCAGIAAASPLPGLPRSETLVIFVLARRVVCVETLPEMPETRAGRASPAGVSATSRGLFTLFRTSETLARQALRN